MPFDKELGQMKFDEIDYVETYTEMEKLLGTSLKGLGVSNFNEFQLTRQIHSDK